MEVNHEVAKPFQILPLHGNECHLGHGVGRVRACGNTRTRPTDGYGDSGAASDRNRAADACPGDAAPDGNRAANERCAAAARPPRVYFSLGGELDPVLCHCEPPKAAALYSARNLCAADGIASRPTGARDDGKPAPELKCTPPGCVDDYTVRAGDTLYSISRMYGVSAYALMSANRISNPNSIHVGQTLCIPRGTATPVPTATRS